MAFYLDGATAENKAPALIFVPGGPGDQAD
ncbi:hypothetical protein MEBOL_000515 [Melittangium boletus DSM 14713]|uniref:Alpha/beta hydrolase n=1 Tax=Melittangium boletus DSM 14713 TaxID=1294270 RepID=A0A250I7A1_9BACT|nr:hypothetical protein MEBOL_000515 [Melittangium boletus DSM 14713]